MATSKGTVTDRVTLRCPVSLRQVQEVNYKDG